MVEFLSFLLPLFLKINIDYIMMVLSFIFIKFMLFGAGYKYMMSVFLVDDLGMIMVIMSCWIFMIVILITKKDFGKARMIIYVILPVLLFFIINNLVLFFMLFEFSLLPMLFIVIGFGQQPERIKSGRWMFIYTLLASIPLFFCIFYIYFNNSVQFMSFMNMEGEMFYNELDNLIYIGMILAMLVKVPMFIFHSWLPKAHVEAPLEGSMILAGIMLKMGVFGLMRFMVLTPSCNTINIIIMSISLVGSTYACWMALSMNDVKMTVAYSSVSHMNFLIACLMSMKMFSTISSTVIMVSHGLCSSMMFYLMTDMYTKAHSRSMYIMKGIVSQFPLMVFVYLIIWSINLSAPPSMSFVGEIIGGLCITSKSVIASIVMCFYVLFNSFYCVFNFSIQCHSSNVLSLKSNGPGMLIILSSFWMIFPMISMFFMFDLSPI